jgi:uncharacterized membrane protein YfcA
MSGWLQFAFLSGNPPGVTEFTVGLVDFGTGLPLISGSILGGFIGVRINHTLSPKAVRMGFAVLILMLATVMLSNIY